MSIGGADNTGRFTVPGIQEWGPESADVDEAYARRIFFGKTAEQTFPLFARNPIERASELRFMPSSCFPYYMLAFKDYLLLDSTLTSDTACDAASCFIGLVEDKLSTDASAIAPVMKCISPILQHLALHQEDYDADRDIYGDFSKRVAKISELVSALKV